MPDSRPIGVFDSGVGGLTVLQALHDLLPAESTIYLGDLARCPYGTRPREEVRDFAIQIADLLASEDIKLLVIACNTATASAFDELARRYAFPVIGVVDPGAAAAVETTCNGRIGVVATNATTASGAYGASIRRLLPSARVFERAASWLVPLVERGSLARARVAEELQPTLDDLQACGVDTLILGCTHFPLVRDIFESGVGAHITVIDSAVTTAQCVAGVLRANDLLSDGSPAKRLLVTGPAEAFAERAQAMFRASPVIETVDVEPALF
jgi:glutamate racemase